VLPAIEDAPPVSHSRADTVADVRAYVVEDPLPHPYGDANGFKHSRGALFVRLESAAGVVGWGDAHGVLAPLAAVVEGPLRAALTGLPVFGGDEATARLARVAGGATRAVSAVETALWDLRARSVGRPVHDLLGGANRTRVPAYAAGGYYGEQWDGDRLPAWAEQVAERGFRHLKMKIGGRPVAEDLARIRAVHAAVAGRVTVLVDANSAYDRTTARRVGRVLDELGVGWFEDPLPIWDLEGHRQLSQALDVAVGGAEQLTDVAAFATVLRAGAMDVVMPDLSVVGGLGAAWRVAVLGAAAGVVVAPHTWGTGLQQAANLHLLAAMSAGPHAGTLAVPMLEFDLGEFALREAVLEEPLSVHPDGTVAVPAGPGLGVTVRESALASTGGRR
jgi:D-galactarolactone cycloisomerase